MRAALPVLLALLAGLPPAASPGVGAQEPGGAAAVADEYLRGMQAGAWRATAQRIHPRAMERLRRTLRSVTRPESSRDLLEGLSGGRTAEEYFSLDDGSLFVSALRLLTRESPGIVNAMTDRDTEVAGTVAEGDTLRHVVYRLQWRLPGAQAEMKVMTLVPDERGRWRVLRAPELASLRPALMGLVLRDPPRGERGSARREPAGPARPM